MAYIEFKGIVKKASLKPDGEVEIVLTVPELRGKMDRLHEMLGEKIAASFDSMVVSYNIEINTQTEKPMKQYKVDAQGIVSEVKPEGGQVEMELEGVPKEQISTKTEKSAVEKTIIEEFILAGLASSYEDLPYDFQNYMKRIRSGETYLKIANELEMSSGRVSEIFDQYYERIAPLAVKWDEWRQGKIQSEPIAKEENKATEKSQSDAVEFDAGEEDEQVTDISKEELDQFILEHRPAYEDIPFDFPALLEKRLQENKSWREIASEVGMTTSQLSSKWNIYKKRVARQMQDGAA